MTVYVLPSLEGCVYGGIAVMPCERSDCALGYYLKDMTTVRSASR